MNLLPMINGYAQKFLTWDNLLFFIVILLILGIVALVIVLPVYFYRKYRNRSDSEKKENPETIPASILLKTWKKFLKQIPLTVRPNILVYEYFIVFGEAGSGKSTLIDNYTNWTGNALQFYPSYTDNPLLQIYIGSKVLVQEIAPSLLGDTSKYARRALLKLWKPLFRRKDPNVVIVLNGMELQNSEPEYLEYLKQKAHIIRGKINLLGQIRKKPVKVRIALTYMDQMGGFSEFAEFLKQNSIPMMLEFKTGDAADIHSCLDSYEKHLSLALKSLTADKYLKTITFLRQTPNLFQHLHIFVKYLRIKDPLSIEPEITKLFLASQTEEQTPVLNPFTPSVTAREIIDFDPNQKHRIAALATGIAGFLYLFGSYIHQQNLVSSRYASLAAIEIAPPSGYDEKMHELLPLTYLQQNPFMEFLPDFFPETARDITRRCMENIRKLYLFPALELASAEMSMDVPEADSRDRAVYLLGLIYAARDNELGRLIQNNPKPWSRILDIPETMILDYTSNNETSWHIALDEKKPVFGRTKSVADDPQNWMVFFTDMKKLYQQPFLIWPEFEYLQKKIDGFLGVIQQQESYDLFPKIVKLLKKEVSQDLNLDMIVRKESDIRQKPVKDFLEFIKNSSMDYPEVTNDLDFTGLLENLKVMSNYRGDQTVKDLQFSFIFGGEKFSFSAQQWIDLVNRSRINLFLKEFINHNKNRNGLLFFPSDKEFDDIVMNASNDGGFLFIGNASVDGRFTRNAVEKRIKPILTELPAIIEKSSISDDVRRFFSDFLFKEVDIYGQHYARYYREYYMEFDIKAESPGALRFVLGQIASPSSPLREIMLTMKDNTQIEGLDKNEFMRALAVNLAEFDFVKRLMGEQAGKFPEFDKYKAILEQMQMDIQDQKEPAPKKDDQAALLMKRLSPLGRTSFAIFNSEKDSYLNLVKQWLDSVGVPPQWQNVFLAPVWQAYFLGMAEIETEIDKIWTELCQNDIQPLYTKFPFRFSSSEDISMEEIKNATHPSGHFWQAYQGMLKPFCVEESQKWREIKGPFNVPRLPSDMRAKLSALSKISSVLWDNNGKERPLEIMIRPGILPSVLPEEPIPTLSYLNVGESSVFGFNQKPNWKKLVYIWQNSCTASAGIEFATKNQPEKIRKTIEIPASYWSFFHLLKKTREYSKDTSYTDAGSDNSKKTVVPQTVTWVVNSPATTDIEIKDTADSVAIPEEIKREEIRFGSDTEKKIRYIESRPVEVVFTIQGNPWEIFRLPR